MLALAASSLEADLSIHALLLLYLSLQM